VKHEEFAERAGRRLERMAARLLVGATRTQGKVATPLITP
jgi:hypothetical protein